MRPYALVSIALLLAACSHAETQSTDASTATPSPLKSCEARQITLDGVSLMIQANVDATVGRITILDSPNEETTAKALLEEKRLFGEMKPDSRTQTQAFKDGLVKIVDMCGNPATFNPPASPTPSPSQK